MDKRVKMAIKQAVESLVSLSLDGDVIRAGGLKISYMGNYRELWVTTYCINTQHRLFAISEPFDKSGVPLFLAEVAAVALKIKRGLK